MANIVLFFGSYFGILKCTMPDPAVLVTGAAGFLGSHLCEALLNQGAYVIGVDNLLTGRESNLSSCTTQPNFQFIKANVIDPTHTYLPANIAKIDLILHFASPASPPRYQKFPLETWQVNTLGTQRLLDWIHQHSPATKFVFASTSEVYGDPQAHPQPESYWGNVNPNGVRSCYDESKRAGEAICGVYEREMDLDVRIARIFNTYGERMDPDDGRVIPSLIKQAVTDQRLQVFGDGRQTRSYCYVSDLVNGIVSLALADNLSGETINLGNDQEMTVLDTAKLIHRLIHGDRTEPKIDFLPLPADDPKQRCPDLTKARQLLNYQPQVGLEVGLRKTIEGFRK